MFTKKEIRRKERQIRALEQEIECLKSYPQKVTLVCISDFDYELSRKLRRYHIKTVSDLQLKITPKIVNKLSPKEMKIIQDWMYQHNVEFL